MVARGAVMEKRRRRRRRWRCSWHSSPSSCSVSPLWPHMARCGSRCVARESMSPAPRWLLPGFMTAFLETLFSLNAQVKGFSLWVWSSIGALEAAKDFCSGGPKGILSSRAELCLFQSWKLPWLSIAVEDKAGRLLSFCPVEIIIFHMLPCFQKELWLRRLLSN